MYYTDAASAVPVGGSGVPVHILVQAPPSQLPGHSSRVTMVPVVAESHGCGPTLPAAVNHHSRLHC